MDSRGWLILAAVLVIGTVSGAVACTIGYEIKTVVLFCMLGAIFCVVKSVMEKK